MAKLKTVTNETVADDPARAELRAAATAFFIAGNDLDRCKASIERARAALEVAEAERTAASGLVEEALRARVARLVDAAVAGNVTTADDDDAAGEARVRQMKAADNVEIAKAVLASVEAPLSDFEYVARKARTRLAESAKEVMQVAIEPLLVKAETARRQMVEAQAALKVLFRDRGWGLRSPDEWRIARAIENAPNQADSDALGEAQRAAEAEWRAAHLALQQNPDAPLPPI